MLGFFLKLLKGRVGRMQLAVPYVEHEPSQCPPKDRRTGGTSRAGMADGEGSLSLYAMLVLCVVSVGLLTLPSIHISRLIA